MTSRLSRRDVLRAMGGTLVASPGVVRAADAGGALDDLLSRRRMVRRFGPEPPSTATIRRLIAAAVRAPSAGHTQPVAFVVVRHGPTRTRLGQAAFGQTWLAAAPVVLVVCADLSRSRPRYGARAERYGMIDAAFASLCLLFAVVEAGLGACFVGAFDDAEVARIVRLPPDVRPVAVVPIGHPAERPKRMRVRRVADVVHRERW